MHLLIRVSGRCKRAAQCTYETLCQMQGGAVVEQQRNSSLPLELTVMQYMKDAGSPARLTTTGGCSEPAGQLLQHQQLQLQQQPAQLLVSC